jgi:hypothetical protein
MTIRNSTIAILAALRDGIDPRDGSPLPGDHLCQAGDVVRALFDAVAVLEAAPGAEFGDGDDRGERAEPAAESSRRLRRGRHAPATPEDETTDLGGAAEFGAVAAAARAEGAEATSRRPRPANAGQPWRDDDDRRLVELFDGGASLAEIATAFARTRGSIRARLVLLGRGDLVGPGPALRYPVAGSRAREASEGGDGARGADGAEDADGGRDSAVPAGEADGLAGAPQVPGRAEDASSAGLVAEPFAAF